MSLDLTSFEKSIQSLKEALDEYEKRSDSFIRDSCIQRFKYTYDLSHKILKRQLKMESANPAEFDNMNFNDLIRNGCKKGFLRKDLEAWRTYREQRNITSHAYNESKAMEVFNAIPDFYQEAHYLLQQLLKRNPQD